MRPGCTSTTRRTSMVCAIAWRGSSRGRTWICPFSRSRSRHNVSEERVTFPSGSVNIAGTLAWPEGSGRVPAVALIPESGPQLRDGNPDTSKWYYAPGTPKGDLFKRIAEQLRAAGIASVRYDKRGCGESDGDYGDVDALDLREDARSAVAF